MNFFKSKIGLFLAVVIGLLGIVVMLQMSSCPPSSIFCASPLLGLPLVPGAILISDYPLGWGGVFVSVVIYYLLGCLIDFAIKSIHHQKK